MADPRRLAPLLALLALTGCGSAVDRGAVEGAVAMTFANLYGTARPDASPASTGASASCRRGPAAAAQTGAGDDWACLVSWVDPGGRLQQAAYGLQVAPDGCFRADPENAAAGATGPGVAAFDGCTREG